ncbi:MAG TPA: DUF427 domain-containing protein [Nocardioidaceae bacterium]|nr:DUF427 domain-containing protein [Nocardioidaceae bacterium]
MALKMRRHLMASVPQLRFEQLRQRVRVLLGDRTVCDTTNALLVWEPRRLVPVYAVPEDALRAQLLPSREPVTGPPDGLPSVMGPADFAMHTCPGLPLDVNVAGQLLADAAFRPDDADLAGYVLLDFLPFTWLEEDRPAVGHPRDPFKRIDTLRSSRHVAVSFEGAVLADTRRATALLETHLPTRWYIPRADVRMDLLEPSEHRTTCAYKGNASYYSVAGAGEPGRAIAWTYPDPLHDAEPVRGLVCFFNERTDISVDGEVMVRPVTPWSSPQEQQALLDQAGDLSTVELG